MNEPKNQIFKSEIFKKRNMKMSCFSFKLRGSQQVKQFCLRFSKRFFVSPMRLLHFFHSCQIVIHLCFCKESVISVFYPRLPQSFDQNTKQNKTPCSRISSKNKENICLQSHLSLFFFLFKKCFRCLLKSGVTEIEFKDRDF